MAFVVCFNDYPHCTCPNQESAEEYVKFWNSKEEKAAAEGSYRRGYYHWHAVPARSE